MDATLAFLPANARAEVDGEAASLIRSSASRSRRATVSSDSSSSSSSSSTTAVGAKTAVVGDRVDNEMATSKSVCEGGGESVAEDIMRGRADSTIEEGMGKKPITKKKRLDAGFSPVERLPGGSQAP